MILSEPVRNALRELLSQLFPGRENDALQMIAHLATNYGNLPARSADELWSERDAVLITYGDQVRQEGQPPLEAQREFLIAAGLDRALSTVHFLPFCPYSSDDGFSVIDYRQIDPAAGSLERR